MAIRFAFHENARESLRRWRLRLAANRRGADELALVYILALTEELIRTSGKPPGAQFIQDVSPQTAYWEFQYRETWVVLHDGLVAAGDGGFEASSRLTWW